MADTEDVNNDELEESSTSKETDDNSKAAESSTDASDTDKGSQSVETESSDVVADAAPTKDQLIAELTGKTKQKAEAETEEVEAKVEADETEDDDSAKEETSEETDLSDEEINAPLGKDGSKGARERIQNLVKQRNDRDKKLADISPMAEFGKNILDAAKEAQMDPAAFAAWISLGIDTHKDVRNLPTRLLAEAKRQAAAHGIALPIETQTLAPKELDEIEEMLISDLADGNIPADVMKRYRDKIRAARTSKSAAPAPAQPVPQQPPAQPQTQYDPMKDPTVQSGIAEIQKVQTEYSKRSDWAKVKAAVDQRMSAYKGTHPSIWGQNYKREVELYIKEHTVPVKKAPSAPLRSTTTTSAAKPKSGKDEAIGLLRGIIK